MSDQSLAGRIREAMLADPMMSRTVLAKQLGTRPDYVADVVRGMRDKGVNLPRLDSMRRKPPVPTCRGRKVQTGLPCQAPAVSNGYCRLHDPARHRTGPGAATIAKVERLDPNLLRSVFDLLVCSMDEVYDGTLSPSRALAISSLASASVNALKAGELEDAIRRMQQIVLGGDQEGAVFEGMSIDVTEET